VILRRSKKTSSSPASKVTVEDLRKLATFRSGVRENLLQSILANSHVIRPPAGSWEPEDEADELYFLHRGDIQFSAEYEAMRKLRHDLPAASYPIPTDLKWSMRVGPGTEILAVPSRYLDLDNESHVTEEPLDLTGDELSSEIYIQFYEAVKNNTLQLPSLPDIAVRIGKAIDDPNTDSEDIARLIQLDPSLAARIMGVVNSAAFGAAEPIRNLNQAVTRLGRQQVRNLVFSCIIKGLFDTNSTELKAIMQSLWRHSASVAAISFVLARVTPGLDPNRALLAGLIHDIGAIPILLMAQDMPQVKGKPEVLVNLINRLKGEVGAMALDAWNFDPELVALALEAEHWQRRGTALPDYLDVVLLAQLHSFVGDKPNAVLPKIDEVPAFEKLALGQLTPRHSIGVLDNAAKDIEEVERMLSIS